MTPIQLTAVFMTIGCALGAVFRINPVYILPFLMLSLSLWISPIFDKKPKYILFAFFAGLMLVSLSMGNPPEKLWQNSGAKFKVTGLVVSVRENSARRSVFDMNVSSSQPKGLEGVHARCYSRPNEKIAIGSQVEFLAYSKTPSSASNPGEFDFAAYLQSNDVSLMLSSYETPKVIGFTESITTFFQGIRQKMNDVYAANLPKRYSDLLDSMVFGKRELPDDISRNFTRTGTSHVVAASGFNISIIAFSSYFLMLWLTGNRKSSLICAIVLTIVYAFLAGFAPSVSRAMVMAILSIISQLTSRKHDAASGLAIALIILLAINPLWITDAGFQLSFLSTFCLFVVAPIVFKLETRKPWYYKILSMLIITMAIQLLTLPILVTRFHAFSTVAPATNLIVIPIASILTPIGALAAVLGLIFPALGTILCYLALPLLAIMDKTIEILASPTWSLLSAGTLQLYAWVPYYLACGLGLALATKTMVTQTRNAKIAFMVAILFLSSNFFGIAIATTSKFSSEVTFLDVGHGDAIFIRTESGKTILIDGGGGAPYLPSGDTGQRIVIPFLRYKGINRIDYVIATHRDQDHIGGLPSVIRDFPIGEIFDSGVKGDTYEASDFENLIKGRHINCHVPSCLEKTTVDSKTEILFLGVPDPQLPGSDLSTVTNNNSLACIISIDGVKFMFGADIQTEAMLRQIELGSLIKTDIMKIPHHGGYSPSFSSWLETVKPRLAINSDSTSQGEGLDSRIESSFDSNSIPVISTARNGSIAITVDDGKWWVNSFRDK
ncbi:MAG: DNA internalization-related competence protein ComEC/Rec2 [Caldisericia bacterium]|nr:DNA internalization-related competence protein ComEC/Rec2 [Caldisericia bacterium]